VIVGERGGFADVAKLLDFGLVHAVRIEAGAEKITHAGALVGTPAYMSPEQAGGEEVDARTDIYSCGALAYFLVAGRPPFVGKSALEVVAAHLRDEVPPPSAFGAEVPGDLWAVIRKCLQKDPGHRHQSADGLDRALGQCQCAGSWTSEQAAEWWKASSQGVGNQHR
jgi:eukaryotic-like serine/threonine-protein kinase